MMVLFVLGLLCLLYLLQAFLYDKFWTRGLDVQVHFQEEYLLEGEIARLVEVVTNDKLLPLPVVEIDFHMDKRLQFTDEVNNSVSDRTYRRDVFALAPRQKITRTLEIKCLHRGYFQITQTGITAQNIFLTKKYLTNTTQNTDFYVLPRPLPVWQVNIPFSRIMGSVLSRKKVYDDPFEFAGLREYSRSDPMKYINWKATARTGEMLTNIHESTLSQRVVFLLDMEGSGLQQADVLNEVAVRVVAALCERLLFSGIEVDVLSNGKDVLTGKPLALSGIAGSGSILFLKKALSRVEAENGLAPICSFFPKEQKEGEDLYVLVSRSQEQQGMEDFSRFTGKGKNLRVIPYLGEKKELVSPGNVETLWMEV